MGQGRHQQHLRDPPPPPLGPAGPSHLLPRGSFPGWDTQPPTPHRGPAPGLPLATCGSPLGQGLPPSSCPEGHPRVALAQISGPPWAGLQLGHQGQHPVSLGGHSRGQVTSPVPSWSPPAPQASGHRLCPLKQTPDTRPWSSPPNAARTSCTSGPGAGAGAALLHLGGPTGGTGPSDTGVTLLCL